MARVRRRRRRTPPRGRGGRFTSRRGRRRRARRNSWFNHAGLHARAARKGWRRRRRKSYRRNPVVETNAPRRRRRRRNPWARFRIPGRSQRQWRGRRGRFRARRNPVVPVSWNRGRRRRYRRNSVLSLPAAFNNPMGVVGAVLGRAQDFIDISFWTDTALPAVGGFLGSKVVGKMVYGLVGEKLLGLSAGDKSVPFVRAASNALAGAGLAWAAGNFLGRKYEEKVWLGVIVSVGHDILKALLGGTEIAKTIGLDGLGDDLSAKMKEAVARRIEQEGLSGNMGHYLTQEYLQRQALNGNVGEFLTDQALRQQPGYGISPSGDLRDYEVARTETAL